MSALGPRRTSQRSREVEKRRGGLHIFHTSLSAASFGRIVRAIT